MKKVASDFQCPVMRIGRGRDRIRRCITHGPTVYRCTKITRDRKEVKDLGCNRDTRNGRINSTYTTSSKD